MQAFLSSSERGKILILRYIEFELSIIYRYVKLVISFVMFVSRNFKKHFYLLDECGLCSLKVFAGKIGYVSV